MGRGDLMILAIVGPTGVGKTKLSIELAKIYNGEIINADSMQIYEGLDIGTAKCSKEEQQKIPHHLLSIKKINEHYSVFDYQKDARKKIDEIQSKNKIPIFVGGTGYYLKAALYDYNFKEENNINSSYSSLSNEEIIKRIESFETGIVYDKRNRKRLLRLLERLENNDLPKTSEFTCLYNNVIFIGLTTNREVLYQKIDERFDKMLIPLIDEVKPFCIHNIKSKPLMTGIGYKEFYPFFENKKTLAKVVEECKKNSRNYAKRQYTWFLNQMDIEWFSVNYENFKETINEIISYIENQNKK